MRRAYRKRIYDYTPLFTVGRERPSAPARDPDMQISRIRLSDKTSRLHPRHVVPKRSQADEPEVPVQGLEVFLRAAAMPEVDVTPVHKRLPTMMRKEDYEKDESEAHL